MTDKIKEYTEYSKSRTEQLDLFSNLGNIYERDKSRYSATVELYDLTPKYFYGEQDRMRTRDGFLQIIKRQFIHRKAKMLVEVTPANLLQRDGSTKSFYPSYREEIVEDTLRKFSIDKTRNELLDGILSVKFTLYELYKELKLKNHEYNYEQIIESLEILTKTNIKIQQEGADKDVELYSNMFETFSIVNTNKQRKNVEITDNYGKGVCYYVRFNTLVTNSIKNKTWKLINYEQCMSYRTVLSRYLHKRISHMFSSKDLEMLYSIMLTTLFRDTGLIFYTHMSENIRRIERSLNEMKKIGSITDYKLDKVFFGGKKNKIEDVKISLFISSGFHEDIRRGFLVKNKKNETVKTNKEEVITSKDKCDNLVANEKNINKKDSDNKNIPTNNDNSMINHDHFTVENIIRNITIILDNNGINIRKENLYKIVNNYICKNISKETIMTNVNEAIGYMLKQLKDNNKINPTAIITSAIKNNWGMNKKGETMSLSDLNLTQEEQREKKKQDILKNIENIKDINIREIKMALFKKFGYNIYSVWFKNLELVLDRKNNKFTLYTENDFMRYYIEKEYFEGLREKVNEELVFSRKGIKQVIQDMFPGASIVLSVKNGNK
jgi:hypothetical protein